MFHAKWKKIASFIVTSNFHLKGMKKIYIQNLEPNISQCPVNIIKQCCNERKYSLEQQKVNTEK